METDQPQFAYWMLVFKLQLCVLQLVNSVLSADFKKYIESLTMLMPWFFALDHINYAHWLAVHIRDLSMLESSHHAVFQEFMAGSFTVQKSHRVFSSIALDQAHEQCNALVKGEGGAIGLTSNLNALKRWMIAGPEISSIIKEFEAQLFAIPQQADLHHDQIQSVQNTFMKEFTAVVSAFQESGNPFDEDSGYLIALDTKNIMWDEVVHAARNMVSMGTSQYHTFIKERFVDRSKAVRDTIMKNQLPTFSRPGKAGKAAAATQMSVLFAFFESESCRA